MSRVLPALALVLAALAGAFAWGTHLVRVEAKGTRPEPLRLLEAGTRRTIAFDASLPMVPVGVQRVTPTGDLLLVHFWAPWERHSGPQAVALDSLRRVLPPGELTVAVVCFDPYPSVSRYVARMRLRLPVLLDLQHALADRLPCPRVPYTYVVDHAGRIAIEQAGEVDWLAPATRAVLDSLRREPPAERPARPAAPPS